MIVLSLLLPAGHEFIGCTNHYKVEFGIYEIPKRTPRKMFRITDKEGDEPINSFMLCLERVVGYRVIPTLGPNMFNVHGTMPSDSVMGIDLVVHSNDVLSLNCALEPRLDLFYRTQVGLVEGHQVAMINHSEDKQ